jgi:hypothetical protein
MVLTEIPQGPHPRVGIRLVSDAKRVCQNRLLHDITSVTPIRCGVCTFGDASRLRTRNARYLERGEACR